MRKLWFTLSVGALLTMGAVQAAFDGTVNVKLTTGGSSPSGGGEFTVTVQSGLNNVVTTGISSTGPTFKSFCLERNEYITDQSTTLYHVIINNQAVRGGVGGPKPDPISIGTAWLYAQAQAGTLADYTAVRMQEAVWYLEQEVESATAGAQLLLTQIPASLGNPMDDANGAYGVVVLNLYSTTSIGNGPFAFNYNNQNYYYVQDMVATVVPEPTTILAGALLLLPFGLSAVRVLRRKQMT